MKSGGQSPEAMARLQEVLAATVRVEKVIHKDAKVRTFIQEDGSREHLTMHAYDVHYGTIRRGQDAVVALDDSIVRGNTLKNAILRTLDRMGPTHIIVISSCPQACNLRFIRDLSAVYSPRLRRPCLAAIILRKHRLKFINTLLIDQNNAH